jgi:protoheme IX farnesyltransferase
MERTADRPLPAGRLPPSWALAQGLGLAALGTILLVLAANALTAALGALAFALYVTAYTPLKRFTPLATAVGAIPGAIPPLMGWTSATGRVDAGGALLFAVLFLWQMPHFLAISIYRGADYARAGLHVGVADRGDRRTRWEIVAWSVAFLAACLALPAAGVGGRLTTAAALLFAGSFLVHGARGLRYGAGEGWARALFWHSLLALAGFFSAMVVDQLRS